MPEFIVDMGSPEGAKLYQQCDAFTQGYIEAMFFTSTGDMDDGSNGDLESATVAELAPETWDKICAQCATFQEDNAALIEQVYGLQGKGERAPYDAQRAGNDYWYTRNGHGTGFWDRGLGDINDQLAKAARHHESTLYRGDDGLLYLE